MVTVCTWNVLIFFYKSLRSSRDISVSWYSLKPIYEQQFLFEHFLVFVIKPKFYLNFWGGIFQKKSQNLSKHLMRDLGELSGVLVWPGYSIYIIIMPQLYIHSLSNKSQWMRMRLTGEMKTSKHHSPSNLHTKKRSTSTSFQSFIITSPRGFQKK